MYRIDKMSQALQRSINTACCWWQRFCSKVIHNQRAGPVSLQLETAVCKSSRKRKTCRSRFTGLQVTWRRDLGQRGTSGSVLSSLVLTCHSKNGVRLFHHITPWIQEIIRITDSFDGPTKDSLCNSWLSFLWLFITEYRWCSESRHSKCTLQCIHECKLKINRRYKQSFR